MHILLVDVYGGENYSYKTLYDEVLAIKENKQVDLLVFPEGFATGESVEEAWDFIRYTSHLVKTPVICGFVLYDGRELVLYINGAPASGETSDSLFANHSTADKLDFEIDRDLVEGLNPSEPILLNDRRIHVHMGRDMVSLGEGDVDVLINLASSNVAMEERCNVLKKQSIKLGASVLCTTTNRTNQKQPSDHIGFRVGKRLKANDKWINEEMAHAFSLFSIDNPIFEEEVMESQNDLHKLQ